MTVSSVGQDDIGVRPRGAWRLAFDPGMGAIFWGKLFANIGGWMHAVAAVIITYQATGSAAATGLLSLAQFAPVLALAPTSGAWADRGDRVRQMIVGRTLCVAGSGVLCANLLASQPSGTALVQLVAATSLVVGFGIVIGEPAMQSMIPDVVAPRDLPTAMALISVPSTVGRIVGPILGAYAVAEFGASIAFGVAALFHVLPIACVALASLPRRAALKEGQAVSVRGGLAYARSDRTMVLILLATVAVGLAAEPMLILAPAIAHKVGGDAEIVGLLMFLFGIGALIGTATISQAFRRLDTSVTTRLGLTFGGLGAILVATGDLYCIYAAFVIGGVGLSWGVAGSTTMMQQRADPLYRGRMMALWLMAFVGTRPIAAVAVGTLADLTAVASAFLASGVLVLVAAVGCRCSPPKRSPQVPEVSPQPMVD